ncbi:MAG: uracil-DNA glycosylase [Planctomycetota bacterium]|nr:MAG: uracil-DNA glycosylase [Planctomycetota bacterium]
MTPHTPAESSPPRDDASQRRHAKAAALEALRHRHDRECPHCTQATYHNRTVFGEGDPDARLMFVGEAPGAEEDRTGRPFVGRAGQLLDKMIQAMGLTRDQVYIANVLKSRPPNNATPTAEEAAKCGPYLLEQIRIIEPEVIVTLGRPAAQLLLKTKEPMGRLRGVWREYEGVPVMPTFHPAFLLRQGTRENREKVWSDLKQVMDRLGLEDPRHRRS